MAIEAMKMKWQEWWMRNEWRFILVEKSSTQKSGGVSYDELSPAMKTLVTFLLKQMSHDYWDVRAASAIALGKVGLNVDRVRKVLEKATTDRDKNVQESAVLALGMLRARKSAFRLRSILGNKRNDHDLRSYAALALGLMQDRANLQVIARMAKTERKDGVRAACVTALGLIGDEAALKTLLDVFTGRDEARIRALAVTSIGKIGVKEFRQRGRRTPIHLVRYFEKKLLDKQTKDSIRQSLAMILGRFGDERSIEVLRKVVNFDRDKATRAFALLSLAQIKKDNVQKASVREFLRRVLRKEKNVTVRSYAALACGLSNDGEAAKILRGIFKSKDQHEVRAAAAVGLGMLRDGDSLPDLAMEIEKPRGGGDVRRFACIAMGLIGDKAASEYLNAILGKVNEPYLRWSAAIGLAKLGDRSCLPQLVKNLSDGSRITKEAAIRAIGYFRDESQIQNLVDHFEREKNQQVQAMYIVSLGYIGDSAQDVPALRKVSQDFNWLAALSYGPIDFVTRVF
jgi:HEAT repeat protein